MPRRAKPVEIPIEDGDATLRIGDDSGQDVKSIREEPDDKPAPKPKPRSRAAATGQVSASDMTKLVVTGFGLVAAIRQRPWWQVSPQECGPFAEELAALVNNLPRQATKTIARGTSAGAVIIGVGGLVMVRMGADAQYAAETAQPAQQVHGYPAESNGASDPYAPIEATDLFAGSRPLY